MSGSRPRYTSEMRIDFLHRGFRCQPDLTRVVDTNGLRVFAFDGLFGEPGEGCHPAASPLNLPKVHFFLFHIALDKYWIQSQYTDDSQAAHGANSKCKNLLIWAECLRQDLSFSLGQGTVFSLQGCFFTPAGHFDDVLWRQVAEGDTEERRLVLISQLQAFSHCTVNHFVPKVSIAFQDGLGPDLSVVKVHLETAKSIGIVDPCDGLRHGPGASVREHRLRTL
jgi:hypothetical protein